MTVTDPGAALPFTLEYGNKPGDGNSLTVKNLLNMAQKFQPSHEAVFNATGYDIRGHMTSDIGSMCWSSILLTVES